MTEKTQTTNEERELKLARALRLAVDHVHTVFAFHKDVMNAPEGFVKIWNEALEPYNGRI